MDFVSPRRPVSLSLVGGRGHYDAVIAAVLAAQTSIWIATANVKALLIEDHRARPGVRRGSGRATSYRSILAALEDLAARGVELRLLHADQASRPFRAELEAHARLASGVLAMRTCPRVHLKAVIVDGAFLYLGSANWTGAGLGASGTGRRNFELGVITDDATLLDQVQALYDRIWRGAECGACRLRAVCPAPLDQRAAPATTKAAARPARRAGTPRRAT